MFISQENCGEGHKVRMWVAEDGFHITHEQDTSVGPLYSHSLYKPGEEFTQEEVGLITKRFHYAVEMALEKAENDRQTSPE